MKPANRVCNVCSNSFTPTQPHQKFCSKACRVKHFNGTWTRSAHPGLSRSTVGRIGELRVSLDLLHRGYEVFQAVSPGAVCDLAVLKDGKLLRVEVKTGYQRQDGRIMVPVPSQRQHNYDILAVALPDSIVYQPCGTIEPCRATE